VVALYSASAAFTAVKQDGSAVTWGYADGGGDSTKVSRFLASVKNKLNYLFYFFLLVILTLIYFILQNIIGVYSTQGAFAALRDDGRLITWGSRTFGGDSRKVQRELESEVSEVYAALAAFAVKKKDGRVLTVCVFIFF
jgi:hypothetical protein